MVLDWLGNIAENGEKCQRLKEQGKKRIERKISEQQDSLVKLEEEKLALEAQIEKRIQELTKTKSEVVRDSVEKSIVDLEGKKKELEEKRLFFNHSISELETLLFEDAGLYGEYRKRIRHTLNEEQNKLKNGLQTLVSGLILEEAHIKTALCGVNHREPVSVVFVSAPRSCFSSSGNPQKDRLEFPINLWGFLSCVYAA